VGVLDLLLPERCVGCGAGETSLCAACRDALVVLCAPLCERCGAPTSWPVERCRECAGRLVPFARARSAVAYEGEARKLLAAWKEGGRRRLARLAATIVVESVPVPSAEALTFVPAVLDRGLWRGHNPAEELARELGAAWGVPVRALLGRSASPRPQRGLRAAERRRNVRGSFRSLGEVPEAVAVVDDVYTSGSTVAAAARALRSAGTGTVEVVTFARALRDAGRR
jgi:predicted amidophosphoribosyltransferase